MLCICCKICCYYSELVHCSESSIISIFYAIDFWGEWGKKESYLNILIFLNLLVFFKVKTSDFCTVLQKIWQINRNLENLIGVNRLLSCFYNTLYIVYKNALGFQNKLQMKIVTPIKMR